MSTETIILSADETLVRRLERLAAGRKVDVNEFIVRILTSFTDTSVPLELSDLPPKTRAATGILEGLPGRPVKSLVEEAIVARHGS